MDDYKLRKKEIALILIYNIQMAVLILVSFSRVLLFLAGAVLVALTLLSAVQTFVLPRSARDPLVKLVFWGMRGLFNLRLRSTKDFMSRDGVLAFYAPMSLMAVLFAWYILVMLGYAMMFRAIGVESWYHALRDSGSSLVTLGFEPVQTLGQSLLAFSEAIIGLLLVALLIAYLPTMYSAFSRRETLVTLLEVRAGAPPSAVEMIKRYHRIHGMSRLGEVWRNWEIWFADVQESHTSLGMLAFFRSPEPSHSWVTSAGVVLDAAALTMAVVDVPYDPQAALCIRAGYLALRQIAEFFELEIGEDNQGAGAPLAGTISIQREEFDVACAELAANDVPLKPDREQAWRDFTGWRINYDTSLLSLADMVMAPTARWVTDRGINRNRSSRQSLKRWLLS